MVCCAIKIPQVPFKYDAETSSTITIAYEVPHPGSGLKSSKHNVSDGKGLFASCWENEMLIMAALTLNRVYCLHAPLSCSRSSDFV